MFGKKKEVSFCLGVEELFPIGDSDDLMVVGKLKGDIRVGAAAYVSNLGDDDAPVTLTEILGIEVNQKPVKKAKDQRVALKVEKGAKLGLKIASVLYSRDTSAADVHGAYLDGIGNGYISGKRMQLTEADYGAMSLTDLAELRRLYMFLISKKKDQETEELRRFNQAKLDELADRMCKQLFSSREIYYVKNKITGEPHLFTQTYRKPDGNFVTMPPDLLLITKAYLEAWSHSFPKDTFEIVKVENGPEQKGIYNFLGDAFYVNGACGIRILFDDFAIDASKLVEKPDYSGLPAIEIPVTNPDLERWMLLMGQMGDPRSEDEKKIYSVYCGLMDQQLAKAKFLIPMKMEGKREQTGPNEVTFQEGGTLSLAVRDGKKGRQAVCMFTDWRRMEMVYPRSEGWNGMVETIDRMIDSYDIAINATQYIKAGTYIDRDIFTSICNKYGGNDKKE